MKKYMHLGVSYGEVAALGRREKRKLNKKKRWEKREGEKKASRERQREKPLRNNGRSVFHKSRPETNKQTDKLWLMTQVPMLKDDWFGEKITRKMDFFLFRDQKKGLKKNDQWEEKADL